MIQVQDGWRAQREGRDERAEGRAVLVRLGTSASSVTSTHSNALPGLVLVHKDLVDAERTLFALRPLVCRVVELFGGRVEERVDPLSDIRAGINSCDGGGDDAKRRRNSLAEAGDEVKIL